MAVPEFLRNARTMRVYTKARSILIHTRQIVYSEKNIPKDRAQDGQAQHFTGAQEAEKDRREGGKRRTAGKETGGKLSILAGPRQTGEYKINRFQNGQAVLRHSASGQKGAETK